MSDLSPSDRFGQLELEKEVRHDRLGTVWHVDDRASGAALDLRVLPESAASAETRLRIAVDKLAGLAHKRLVGVVRLEEHDGRFGIVQQRGEGEPLPARRARRTRPYFEVSEIKPWAKALLESLSYLHQNGVVHGALHAGAIFVDGPEIQIADLGLHALMETGDDGVFPIPLATVAPDVLAGASPEPADDVYALAAVIYELLTGRAVFHSGDIGSQIESIAPPTVTQRRSELGIDGATVPPAWETWLSAALSKSREQRPGLLDLLAAMAPTLSGADAKTIPAGAAAVSPLAAKATDATAKAKQLLTTAKDKLAVILADPKQRLVAGSVVGIAVLALALKVMGGGDEEHPAAAAADSGAATSSKPERGAELRDKFDQVVASELAEEVQPELLAESWRSFLKAHKNSENLADPKLEKLLAMAEKRLTHWNDEQKRITAAVAAEANSKQDALMENFFADYQTAKNTAEATKDFDAIEAAWKAFKSKYDGTDGERPLRAMEDNLFEARLALENVATARRRYAQEAADRVRAMRIATGPMNAVLDNAESTAAQKMAAAQQFINEFGAQVPEGVSEDLADEAENLLVAARKEVEQFREAAQAETPESPLDVTGLFASSDYGSETYSENGRKHVLKEAQTIMKEAGFYEGSPDGTPGGKTHAALIAYQQNQKLAPTAALDTPTLTSLGLIAIPDNTAPLVVASTSRKTSSSSSNRSKPRASTPPKDSTPVRDAAGHTLRGIKNFGKGAGRRIKELGSKD